MLMAFRQESAGTIVGDFQCTMNTGSRKREGTSSPSPFANYCRTNSCAQAISVSAYCPKQFAVLIGTTISGSYIQKLVEVLVVNCNLICSLTGKTRVRPRSRLLDTGAFVALFTAHESNFSQGEYVPVIPPPSVPWRKIAISLITPGCIFKKHERGAARAVIDTCFDKVSHSRTTWCILCRHA